MPRSCSAVVLCAGVLATCSSSAQHPTGQTPPLEAGHVLTIDATIRFIDRDGGCWVIEAAPGQRYEPVNLGATFRAEADGPVS